MKRIFQLARRATPLLKLAGEYTAANMLARLLAAISGLILVRLLPVNEYGYYTLILSAFTFICTFSDLGVTETLSYFRWRARSRNREWFPFYQAVVRFRKGVYALGAGAAALFVLTMGMKLGVESGSLAVGIILMIMGAWFAIQAGINGYVLKLEQKFRSAYVAELGNELSKFGGALAIWLFGLTTGDVAMASVMLGSLAALLITEKLIARGPYKLAVVSPRRARRNARILWTQILPTLPGAIHFALLGPLFAWLAANYGSIANVAEIGALGRLGVLIALITGFSTSVYVPRLLAITNERVFLSRYLWWWLVMLAFGCLILGMLAVFPEAVLWLLGSSYAGLRSELLVSAAIAIVSTWGSYAYSINRARGWIKYQQYSVPYIVIGQIFLFLVLDFGTTIGVLLFSLGTFIVGFSFQLFLNMRGFRTA